MVQLFLDGGGFMYPILVILIFGISFVGERLYHLISGLHNYQFAENIADTISEHGLVFGHTHMMKEIYERGPIACGINANAILEYKGGILDLPNESKEIDHIISIVGWGYDDISGKQYWIIRNSWGEYWGEMGFIRVVLGDNQLGTEYSCAWAVPGSWTEINHPCNEDGSNC